MYDPDFKIDLILDPVAKGRPRVCRNGRAYTPEKTRRAEEAMRWQIGLAMKDRAVPMFGGPLAVEVELRFARPKSVKRAHHTVKPDIDNAVKLIGDAGNGLIWSDDSQIVQLSARKVYCDRGMIKLWVWRLDASP